MSGDLEIRSKELEQEVTELRERLKETERELWSARRQLRTSRTRSAAIASASKVGLGALLGSLLGVGLYFLRLVTSPPFLFALVVAGGLISMLIRDGFGGGKDDDFPPAPPPRMY